MWRVDSARGGAGGGGGKKQNEKTQQETCVFDYTLFISDT